MTSQLLIVEETGEWENNDVDYNDENHDGGSRGFYQYDCLVYDAVYNSDSDNHTVWE